MTGKFVTKLMSYVAALHLYRLKSGTKLIQSLRPLQVGQGRSFYKRGGGDIRAVSPSGALHQKPPQPNWGGGGEGGVWTPTHPEFSKTPPHPRSAGLTWGKEVGGPESAVWVLWTPLVREEGQRWEWAQTPGGDTVGNLGTTAVGVGTSHKPIPGPSEFGQHNSTMCRMAHQWPFCNV